MHTLLKGFDINIIQSSARLIGKQECTSYNFKLTVLLIRTLTNNILTQIHITLGIHHILHIIHGLSNNLQSLFGILPLDLLRLAILRHLSQQSLLVSALFIRFRTSVATNRTIDMHVVGIVVAFARGSPEGTTVVGVPAFFGGGGAGGVVGGAFLGGGGGEEEEGVGCEEEGGEESTWIGHG